MVYPAHVVNTLIASPSDLLEERQALRSSLWDFNDEHTESNQVVLLPRMWERNSTPGLGTEPQSLLDAQIVDTSDVVIGLFWTRIGQLLPDGIPATVHELERVVAAGKPALLYFSNKPVVPDSIDPEQYAAVRAFKDRARSWGLYREFSDLEELLGLVRRDLFSTIRKDLNLPEVQAPIKHTEKTRIVARIEKRQVQHVNSTNELSIKNQSFLVVENLGEEAAINVSLDWTDSHAAPLTSGIDKEIHSLVGGGAVEFQLMTSFGGADQADLMLSWEDSKHASFQSVQTVRF